jgi:hypothetical protein
VEVADNPSGINVLFDEFHGPPRPSDHSCVSRTEASRGRDVSSCHEG